MPGSPASAINFDRNLGQALRDIRLRYIGSPAGRALEIKSVTPKTIARWESEEVTPQIYNLDSYLKEINATDQEIILILSLLDSRQGAIARKNLSNNHDRFLVSMPGSGDFFLAMRLRAKLNLSDASKRLGINKSTLYRIESSDMLPDEDIIETMALLFGLSDFEKEYIKYKSRLLPPINTHSIEKMTGIGDLAERIANLEMLGRLNIDFPGDLAFLAIEAALAPHVYKENLHAIRLLCRTYIAHGEWLERINRCEGVRNYAQAVISMLPYAYMSPSKIPKSEYWWVRSFLMNSTCDIRNAFQFGTGRKREISCYEKVITDLIKRKTEFARKEHILEIDRCIAGYMSILDGIEPERALEISKKCLEDALRIVDLEQSNSSQEMLLHCRLTYAQLLNINKNPEEALRNIRSQEDHWPIESSLEYSSGLSAWLVRRKSESLRDIGEFKEAIEVRNEFVEICSRYRLEHLIEPDKFFD